MFAMGQPAFLSGRRTVFPGERIFAVSAMKWTPQKTMTSASVWAAWMLSPRESPTKSAMSWTSRYLVVVGQDDGLALGLQFSDLFDNAQFKTSLMTPPPSTTPSS